MICTNNKGDIDYHPPFHSLLGQGCLCSISEWGQSGIRKGNRRRKWLPYSQCKITALWDKREKHTPENLVVFDLAKEIPKFFFRYNSIKLLKIHFHQQWKYRFVGILLVDYCQTRRQSQIMQTMIKGRSAWREGSMLLDITVSTMGVKTFKTSKIKSHFFIVWNSKTKGRYIMDKTVKLTMCFQQYW